MSADHSSSEIDGKSVCAQEKLTADAILRRQTEIADGQERVKRYTEACAIHNKMPRVIYPEIH